MTLRTRWSPSGAARKMAFLFSGAGLRTEPGLRNAAASPTRKPEDPKSFEIINEIIKDTHLQKALSSGDPAILGEPAPNVTSKHAGAKGMIAQTRGFGLR